MPRWTPFEPYFWSKVKIGLACWNWMAGTYGNGYGRVRRGSIAIPAHRVAWELTNGPIPEGLCACHHCDNKLCVNPAHIFLGTCKDNMQDWTRKGKNRLVNDPSLWSMGRHFKEDPKAREKVSESMKNQYRTGSRISLRSGNGRYLGSKVQK